MSVTRFSKTFSMIFSRKAITGRDENLNDGANDDEYDELQDNVGDDGDAIAGKVKNPRSPLLLLTGNGNFGKRRLKNTFLADASKKNIYINHEHSFLLDSRSDPCLLRRW